MENIELKSTAEQVKELVFCNAKDVKVLNIAKSFESWDEFFASDEYNDLWDGWQGKESDMNVKRKFNLLTAFTVDTDPKENYGKNYDLYYLIGTKEAEKYLHKASISSCLSNNALREVLVFDDSVLLTNIYSKKTPEARKYLRKMAITTM